MPYFSLTNTRIPSRYVLVDGILNVSIDKKIVNMMQKGAGFGELALIGNGRRGATVLTKSEYTVVIRIDKLDYNRIMKHAHKKDRQEKRVLLRKIPEIEKLDDIEQVRACARVRGIDLIQRAGLDLRRSGVSSSEKGDGASAGR